MNPQHSRTVLPKLYSSLFPNKVYELLRSCCLLRSSFFTPLRIALPQAAVRSPNPSHHSRIYTPYFTGKYSNSTKTMSSERESLSQHCNPKSSGALWGGKGEDRKGRKSLRNIKILLSIAFPSLDKGWEDQKSCINKNCIKSYTAQSGLLLFTMILFLLHLFSTSCKVCFQKRHYKLASFCFKKKSIKSFPFHLY